VECVLAVFCEVFERLDGLSPQASCDGQGSVPEGCEHLRRGSGTGSALVLAAAHVAHVVQAVLDAPMVARQGQQLVGACFCGGQAGDGVGRLGAFHAAHAAAAGDTADLRQPGPGRGEVGRHAAGGLQGAGLDPAMVLAGRLRPSEVRRG